MDPRARAILDDAKRARKPLPRWMWITAAIVSAVCVGGLVIAVVTDGGGAPRRAIPAVQTGIGGGLGLGLMIGIGVGIAIGSVIAARRR